jgi:hypothetical protein
MLDKDTTKILEANVLERINKLYPVDKAGLNNVIAMVASQAAIVTLQEYEKLTNTN